MLRLPRVRQTEAFQLRSTGQVLGYGFGSFQICFCMLPYIDTNRNGRYAGMQERPENGHSLCVVTTFGQDTSVYMATTHQNVRYEVMKHS